MYYNHHTPLIDQAADKIASGQRLIEVSIPDDYKPQTFIGAVRYRLYLRGMYGKYKFATERGEHPRMVIKKIGD